MRPSLPNERSNRLPLHGTNPNFRDPGLPVYRSGREHATRFRMAIMYLRRVGREVS